LVIFIGSLAYGQATRHFDVGQADATLVVSPTGQTLLIDGGNPGSGNAVIAPFLRSQGITRLNYMLASHYHSDHVGGLDEVAYGGFLPDIAYDRGGSYGSSEFNQYLSSIASVRQTLHPGDVIDLGGGLTASCLVANGKIASGDSVIVQGADQEENARCVGVLFEMGEFDYWISGDLTGGGLSTPNVESLVAPDVGDVDFLRINHHGSSTSTNQYFLNALKPEFSLISLGDGNSYGFPKQDVLNRLNAFPTMEVIYQTETGTGGTASKVQVAHGDILVSTDGSTFTISGGSLTPTTHAVDAVGITGGDPGEPGRRPLLLRNHPNPFFGSTTISFTLAEPAYTSVSVYNVAGQEVAVLLDGKVSAGPQELAFNAKALCAGVYFYKLTTKGFTEMKRCVVVK
jgi:beta-lactamase superfamily II metal-dependent hydrolase